MLRGLLAFSRQERELADLIEDALLARGETDAAAGLIIDSARSAAEVMLRLKQQPYDFVVVALALAAEPSQPVDEVGGLALCERVRRTRRTPLVLIAPQAHGDLANRCAVLDPPPAALAVTPELARHAADLVFTGRQPKRTLNLVIYVRGDEDWSYELYGDAASHRQTGTFPMTHGLLHLAGHLSRILHEQAHNWQSSFEVIGKSLIETFCRQNREFERALREQLQDTGQLEHTRVSFVVEHAVFHLALEALLLPPHLPPLPWMVRAPLSRNVCGGLPVDVNVFDGSQGPIRALIVRADTSGFVDNQVDENGNVLALARLEHVGRECETIAKVLQRACDYDRSIEITLLPAQGLARIDRRQLLEALERGWDIVHFVGHSSYRYLQGREDRGMLYLGGPDAADPIDIAELTPFLRKTKLLYLSSCESGNAAFAVESAKAGVAAVVGYRWPVNDRFALMHAHLFYQLLLKSGSVEIAFWRTRRVMHRHLEKYPIWASSMLVLGSR
jgi:hypothetical protein